MKPYRPWPRPGPLLDILGNLDKLNHELHRRTQELFEKPDPEWVKQVPQILKPPTGNL